MKTKELIIKYRTENPCINMQSIGHKLGVSREYVRYVLKNEGLPTKKFTQRYICLNCGDTIPYNHKLFCNRRCRREYSSITIECNNCGILFKRMCSDIIDSHTRSNGKVRKHFFCSRQCHYNYYKGKTYERRIK